MKKLFFVVTLITIYSISLGQTPSNDPHWQLVWEDNFNSYNSNRWLVANWAQHNEEPQLYLASNVSFSNGNLVIRVNNNPTYCQQNNPVVSGACWLCDNQWYYYTSGWVETKSAYNTQYGYIESRIKIPYGHGFWPAFWTFIGHGVSVSSNSAEIDIFEMTGSDPLAPNSLGTNIHKYYCQDCAPPNNCNCDYLYQPMCPWEDSSILCYNQHLTPINFDYTSWHTYGIEWSPSKIIWYIDGEPVRILPDHGIVDPVRIILNFAIEPWALPDQTTPFPSEMLVDYVKVYKLDNDCNTNMYLCNFNFSTHDNKVKKNITIGNGTCTNTINSGQIVYLRASESVLINGDFTTSLGSELYIDVNPCYE